MHRKKLINQLKRAPNNTRTTRRSVMTNRWPVADRINIGQVLYNYTLWLM